MNAFSNAIAIANQAIDGVHGDPILIDGHPGTGVFSEDPEALMESGVQMINGAVLSILESGNPVIGIQSIITHKGIEYLVIKPPRSTDVMGWQTFILSRR